MGRRRRFVSWMWVVLGTLAGLALLLVTIGSVLPRDHTSRVEMQLAAAPDRVWSLVSDLGGTARWRSDVREVRMAPAVDGRVQFIEVTAQGQTPYEIVSQEAPSRQVVRVVDAGLPFGGTWTWELTPAGSGTRLAITEHGFVRNPVFRVMSRLFFKPTATLARYQGALATALGERAEPVIVRER
jgi:uncharacterized protein YndB with AHSA1/START domain